VESVPVVMEGDGPMPLGEVTEVLRPELPTTRVAATNVSSEASDVSAADVSTATGASGVPATGATASRVPAARAPAAVSHAERDAAVQDEREDDRDTKGEEGTLERAQRPMSRRELHDRSLVASSGWVKGSAAVQERPVEGYAARTASAARPIKQASCSIRNAKRRFARDPAPGATWTVD